MKTNYATFERLGHSEIVKQNISLNNIAHLKNILDASSIIFFIVNEQRQIVFSNQYFLERLNLSGVEKVLGLRPGDSFGCVNSIGAPHGCGTSEVCASCGMLGAIFSALEMNKRVTRETNVVLEGDLNVQLTLEVTASPFMHDGKRFVYFSAIDIEKRKRKELMENIFFHDVLNLIMSLEGYLEIMDDLSDDERARYFPKVRHISSQLLEEITAQRDLVKAENKQLMVNPKNVDSYGILEDIRSKMQFSRVAINKNISIEYGTSTINFVTDKVLLNRVLINMLKNALEASEFGDTVTLRAYEVDGKVRFSVHNHTLIPHELKFQIFQRSVSSKGTGRGLGTYSMKLLGERYLKGKVWYESIKEKGTTFFIEIPLRLLQND